MAILILTLRTSECSGSGIRDGWSLAFRPSDGSQDGGSLAARTQSTGDGDRRGEGQGFQG